MIAVGLNFFRFRPDSSGNGSFKTISPVRALNLIPSALALRAAVDELAVRFLADLHVVDVGILVAEEAADHLAVGREDEDAGMGARVDVALLVDHDAAVARPDHRLPVGAEAPARHRVERHQPAPHPHGLNWYRHPGPPGQGKPQEQKLKTERGFMMRTPGCCTVDPRHARSGQSRPGKTSREREHYDPEAVKVPPPETESELWVAGGNRQMDGCDAGRATASIAWSTRSCGTDVLGHNQHLALALVLSSGRERLGQFACRQETRVGAKAIAILARGHLDAKPAFRPIGRGERGCLAASFQVESRARRGRRRS